MAYWFSRASQIIHTISKRPSNLLAIAGVRKKEFGNKIFAKSVAAKTMSTNAPHIKYDVFVSFRGEDIRHNFLGHLIRAFHRNQIHAFVDEKLRRGDDISPSLLVAIEESFISLVIFSENYASSPWCLEELLKITECKEKYKQIVIPVFYKVDPTDVRNQTKSYRNALADLEKKYKLSKVRNWRRALNKSANLSGIKYPGNDVDLLEEIINLVLLRLSRHPINLKGLTGIGKPIAHLESLLRQESTSVRVIGIWGMGGIGKTTIAEVIFNQNCDDYDSHCFLTKVSEELGTHGIISLKEKLFSKLLKEDVKIDTPNGLSSYIARRIGRMKVLIVLDDINDTNQLKKFFVTLDWFRPDSRIIVTTRDKQVLVNNKVDVIYEVGALSPSEALELFDLNANQRNLRMDFYELKLMIALVKYTKGVPLVIEVLGHLLAGKDREEWKSMLDKLKKGPIKKVYDVMRLSYDDLDRVEQKIFLDIACFFNGLNLKVDFIKNLLKECQSDNSVATGLERLKDKTLITISKDNVVHMHAIIQEMGQEIVRQESEDPGSRSHLWDPDDIRDVLKNDKGTEAIRSIRTNMSEIQKLMLSPHVFAKMSKIQFLSFDANVFEKYSVNLLPQGLQSLSTDLRYLHWINYPLISLPEKFSPNNLVLLDLSGSKVEKLWDGVQNLVNLRKVNLHNCKFLKELPDFSKATNLEVLDIMSYDFVKYNVHPSIFFLGKLVKLNLHSCFSLTKFTDAHLPSLLYLYLGGCISLKKFSMTYENIVELDLRCTRALDLSLSFGCQTPSKLEILFLGANDIESIPSWIENLKRLKYLDLNLCLNLQALPKLPSSLEILYAQGCRSLRIVSFSSTATEQLKENRKLFVFLNCINLNEHSLRNIGLNAQINLMKYAHQHISAPKHDYVENCDDYEHSYVSKEVAAMSIITSHEATYVYPGSNVPDWLEYKATKDEIMIDLSKAHEPSPLGFIFCFILSRYYESRNLILNVAVIDSEGDGDEKGSVDIVMPPTFNSYLEMDHVCLMYSKACSRYLTGLAKNQTRLKIKVTAKRETISGVSPTSRLKAFGVSPINTSTYHNFVQQMELFDYVNK